MPDNAGVHRDRGRVRAAELRVVRGGAVHHAECDGAAVDALQAPGHASPHQGQHRAAHRVLHHLRLPGHLAVLRESLGGGRRSHLHHHRSARLLRHDRLEDEARLARAQLPQLQHRHGQALRLRARRKARGSVLTCPRNCCFGLVDLLAKISKVYWY